MKKIWKIILPIIVLALGVIGYVSLKATAPKTLAKSKLEKIWTVHTKPLKIIDMQPYISEFGTVVSGNQAELRPLVSGQITEVGNAFSRGAIIKAGDMLVTIDPFHYEINIANEKAVLNEVLAKIKETREEIKFETALHKISIAQLALRKRDFERRRKLKKQGSSSNKSADDAEISYNQASQVVTAHEQTINRLKMRLVQFQAQELSAQAALKLANRNLSETRLLAPFDGFLAAAEGSVGQYVDTGDRLARLIQAEKLEIHFRLKKRDFVSLFSNGKKLEEDSSQKNSLIGKEVQVTWQMGDEKLEFIAVIERVGAEIDVTGSGVDVYARLQNIDIHTALRPGAFVEVKIPDRRYIGVVSLPDTALIEDNLVYIIENGRLVEKKIDIIRRNGPIMLVRGEFSEGDVVVTRAFPEISSGLKAVPK